jgi:hypothetical protein
MHVIDAYLESRYIELYRTLDLVTIHLMHRVKSIRDSDTMYELSIHRKNNRMGKSVVVFHSAIALALILLADGFSAFSSLRSIAATVPTFTPVS